LLEGELPDHQNLLKLLDETLPEKMPPQNSSKAEPYREKIKKLLDGKVKVTAIYDRLKEQGYQGSYASGAAPGAEDGRKAGGRIHPQGM
jgi:hypothetical protein